MGSPLAEAYLQSQQAGTPQQPFRAQVAPTDVEKANADYNNAMMQQYAAKLGQQNALWGGLAGLGGAGIVTLPKLLSGGAAAGSEGSSAIASSLGLGSGISDADLLASLPLVL